MEKYTFFNFIFHLTRRLFIQLCCYHCQCHSIKSIFLHLVYSMALKKLSLYLYQMILYLPCSYSQCMQQGIESKWFAFGNGIEGEEVLKSMKQIKERGNVWMDFVTYIPQIPQISFTVLMCQDSSKTFNFCYL